MKHESGETVLYRLNNMLETSRLKTLVGTGSTKQLGVRLKRVTGGGPMNRQDESYEKPRLRPLDVMVVEVKGQQMYALRDRTSENDDAIAVSPQFFYIISHFTGENTLRDIQYRYMQQFGDLLSMEQLTSLINMVDEHLLLESPRFQQHLAIQRQAYLALETRPAIHMNKSYPGNERELDMMLSAFFHDDRGPGSIDETKRGTAPTALVVPHIDFLRGGITYAHGYRALAEADDIDVFIILGTDHDVSQNYFSLSRRPFETPFGTIGLEQPLIDSLVSAVDFDLHGDEFNHRREHSIEFQTVFLAWLYRQRKPFTIVPILCGSYYGLLEKDRRPEQDTQITAFFAALRTTLANYPKKTCVITAVDLSHVGVQFGDPAGPTSNERESVTETDRKLIDLICRGERTAFLDHIYETRNRTNVCGVSPLYTMMNLLPDRPARLLAYDFWYDPDAASMVSFASLLVP